MSEFDKFCRYKIVERYYGRILYDLDDRVIAFAQSFDDACTIVCALNRYYEHRTFTFDFERIDDYNEVYDRPYSRGADELKRVAEHCPEP